MSKMQVLIIVFVEFMVSGGRFVKQNYWFPKHKNYPSATTRREKNRNEVKINTPKDPDGMAKKESLLSQNNIQILKEVLKYTQYHF